MITFVNPKSVFLEKDGMMPNLGLMQLSAVLLENKIPTRIVDLGLGDALPDGELFLTGTTPQLEEMLKLERPFYTVVGGPHASVDPESLRSKFSLIIKGEGEQIITGIAKHRFGGVLQTGRIRDLDALPFPDRRDAHRYLWEINGRKATTMVTSRGCTGRCAFCCKAVMDHGIFFRSAGNVIEELHEVKQLGFGAVMFYDDSIAMIRKRLEDICTGIGHLDLSWRCFVRSDQVDYELFARMAASGCHEVLIGVESGSQKILDAIGKRETVDQHRQAIKSARQAGIKVKALMIVGLPGESWDTINESWRFLSETRPDGLDVTVLSVYPGSPIHQNPGKYDLFFGKPTHYKGRPYEYECQVSTSKLSADDIVEARHMLHQAHLGL